MLIEILDWIAGWPLVAYAIVNATHILGIGLLVRAIVSSDLRTAGIWKEDRWWEGLETCVPVAAAGLVIAIMTGAVLFSVRGGHCLSNRAFLIKLPLVALGLANVFVFRRAMARQAGDAP